MTLKRFIAALTALSVGVALGSCAQVSGAVSDHWPHWAGGEPAGVPPRQGAPGYADYISHKDVAPPPEKAAATTGQPPAPLTPAANAGAPAPAANPAPQDTAVARGGLYSRPWRSDGAAGRWRRAQSPHLQGSAPVAERGALRHAGAQQIVEMHDADRPALLNDEQRRDL